MCVVLVYKRDPLWCFELSPLNWSVGGNHANPATPKKHLQKGSYNISLSIFHHLNIIPPSFVSHDVKLTPLYIFLLPYTLYEIMCVGVQNKKMNLFYFFFTISSLFCANQPPFFCHYLFVFLVRKILLRDCVGVWAFFYWQEVVALMWLYTHYMRKMITSMLFWLIFTRFDTAIQYKSQLHLEILLSTWLYACLPIFLHFLFFSFLYLYCLWTYELLYTDTPFCFIFK